MLNRNRKSRNPCPVAEFSIKASSFSHLSLMVVVGL